MSDEDWRERANSLAATNSTLKDQIKPLRDKVRSVKETLCATEKMDGTIVIDFMKLVEKLGVEKCLELRSIIDERYGISGEAGQKPRVRLAAG